MPLFHPRVLKKNLKNISDIPAQHKATLTSWATNVGNGIYDRETQHDGEFIQRILIDVLGYVGSSAGDSWTLSKNQPVGSGNVDVALGNFAANSEPEILAPFELKGAVTKDLDAVMPGRHKSPVQQAWEYAMDAKGAKWVLLSNYREIRLYAVGYGRKDYEVFDLTTLTQPAQYERFMLLLSAGNLLTGNTLKLLKESDSADKEITEKLYAEYKETRAALIDQVISANPHAAPLKCVQMAQTILDRVLFVAFAEDKGLLRKGTLRDTYNARNPYNPQPIWDNFKGLFSAIDRGSEQLRIPGYNGGLFASNADIDALVISDAMCGRFAALGEYDYESEVSVNILGHVFEQSISDLEDIKRGLDPNAPPADEVESKRRTDGIFYTPPLVTRQVVEQAVGAWLSDQKRALGFGDIKPLTDDDFASIKRVFRGKNRGQVVFNANVEKHIALWNAYRDRLSSIKVLDPACGSGAFLNEVFDFLYQEGQTINRTLETLHGGQINLFRWDTHILANNLFGVDINRESVEITKLSLWLKTANPNEKLSYLDDNIKAGNSLIKDRDIASDLAFDWSAEFPAVMASGGFDVIVGNPPYVDSEAMTRAWAKEREYITRTYEQTKGNWDLYIAFLELGCNLLASEGYLSYITPDKWISKDFGAAIRKRIIPGVVSILPFGRDVFESAIVDSIVTTISAKPVEHLHILSINDGEVSLASRIDKSEINADEGLDQTISPHFNLLRRLERVGERRLKDIAETENACATSDTYVLGPFISDASSSRDYNAVEHYKVANTGTLNKYSFKWGMRPMRYLKNDYLHPVVAKRDFQENLGATYQRRAASPKLIIKGLTLLDAAIDADGLFIPGKSTLVVCNNDVSTLKFIAGVLNSKIASFYIKEKYASASYNGGGNFTPDMLNSLPMPTSIDAGEIVRHVNSILVATSVISSSTVAIHAAIRASGGPAKLRAQLDQWYELTGPEFIKELTRQGLEISVREKSQWVDLLDEHKSLVSPSIAEQAAASDAIDRLLFDAYSLAADERALIDQLG